jgi:parallel beta-helix repeat protein
MAHRVGLLVMAASLWGQAFALSDWSTVAQRAKNSVVKVIARTKKGEATGTGFAVSADGKIATNYHVIESASKIFVKLPNGRTVGIERVVAFDKRVDLAILQVRGVTLRPLPLGDSNAVKVGQEVCVMGSPLGLEQSFSTGVVSAKRVLDGFEWIQITAPISPGNSGSPVMTRSGRVIGVATFGYEKGQNLNFASSVKYLRMLLNRQPIRPERPSAQPPQEPPAPQEPPSSMLVTNASEFVQAISEIKEGGEITLQPGEYRLREPLHIRKSLTISGTGYEETVIVFEGKSIFTEDEGPCGGIKYSGEGMLSIRDVSIRYSGADEGCDVITAVKGDLRLTRCFISGGVGRDEKKNLIGCGVWVHKTSNAVISGCIIADNEVGVGVSARSKARIEFSKILGNGEWGIAIGENASSEVRHCEISNNGIGILASDESRLVARNNTCEGNTYSGIALFGSAQGEVVGNTCRNNGLHGIYADEQSRLVARNNTCEGNKQDGISLFGSAQGEVVGNTCRNNGTDGIAAQEQSRLVARNNTCERNQDTGIALFGSAQGEVEGNRCVNNSAFGIYIHERSVKATLRNNTVYGNRGGDIYDPRR